MTNYIQLVKSSNDTSDRKQLVEGDTVSIIDGKLHIHFAEALSGSNQINIGGGALKDSYGSALGEDRLTSLINLNDANGVW